MAIYKVQSQRQKNVIKPNEARVFISNHYEIYGPLSVYMNFHTNSDLGLLIK